jgi:hypothetical protein
LGHFQLTEEILWVFSHIRLKHQSASYKLPACLEKTLLQKSVPYDTCIDRVIWPSMRDKLISRQYDQQSQAASLPNSVQRTVEDLWSDIIVHPCNVSRLSALMSCCRCGDV